MRGSNHGFGIVEVLIASVIMIIISMGLYSFVHESKDQLSKLNSVMVSENFAANLITSIKSTDNTIIVNNIFPTDDDPYGRTSIFGISSENWGNANYVELVPQVFQDADALRRAGGTASVSSSQVVCNVADVNRNCIANKLPLVSTTGGYINYVTPSTGEYGYYLVQTNQNIRSAMTWALNLYNNVQDANICANELVLSPLQFRRIHPDPNFDFPKQFNPTGQRSTIQNIRLRLCPVGVARGNDIVVRTSDNASFNLELTVTYEEGTYEDHDGNSLTAPIYVGKSYDHDNNPSTPDVPKTRTVSLKDSLTYPRGVLELRGRPKLPIAQRYSSPSNPFYFCHDQYKAELTRRTTGIRVFLEWDTTKANVLDGLYYEKISDSGTRQVVPFSSSLAWPVGVKNGVPLTGSNKIIRLPVVEPTKPIYSAWERAEIAGHTEIIYRDASGNLAQPPPAGNGYPRIKPEYCNNPANFDYTVIQNVWSDIDDREWANGVKVCRPRMNAAGVHVNPSAIEDVDCADRIAVEVPVSEGGLQAACRLISYQAVSTIPGPTPTPAYTPDVAGSAPGNLDRFKICTNSTLGPATLSIVQDPVSGPVSTRRYVRYDDSLESTNVVGAWVNWSWPIGGVACAPGPGCLQQGRYEMVIQPIDVDGNPSEKAPGVVSRSRSPASETVDKNVNFLLALNLIKQCECDPAENARYCSGQNPNTCDGVIRCPGTYDPCAGVESTPEWINGERCSCFNSCTGRQIINPRCQCPPPNSLFQLGTSCRRSAGGTQELPHDWEGNKCPGSVPCDTGGGWRYPTQMECHLKTNGGYWNSVLSYSGCADCATNHVGSDISNDCFIPENFRPTWATANGFKNGRFMVNGQKAFESYDGGGFTCRLPSNILVPGTYIRASLENIGGYNRFTITVYGKWTGDTSSNLPLGEDSLMLSCLNLDSGPPRTGGGGSGSTGSGGGEIPPCSDPCPRSYTDTYCATETRRPVCDAGSLMCPGTKTSGCSVSCVESIACPDAHKAEVCNTDQFQSRVTPGCWCRGSKTCADCTCPPNSSIPYNTYITPSGCTNSCGPGTMDTRTCSHQCYTSYDCAGIPAGECNPYMGYCGDYVYSCQMGSISAGTCNTCRMGSFCGCGGSCFVAGTMVDTPSGPKAIDKIKVGDEVYSYDEERRERVVSHVTKSMVHENKVYGVVEISSGVKIQVTGEHPFWVVDKSDWVPIKDIEVGTRLLYVDETGSYEVYLMSKDFSKPSRADVYNIQVEKFHNYFVNGVLVHNKIEQI